jgi:hypothetical protein
MKLLLIIFVWIAAWTPFATILVFQMAGYEKHINNVVKLMRLFVIQ